jgi:hypothetical protein
VVYFDHWAHARFSRDRQLGETFAAILHDRQGTLALSILNLAEFSGLTDLAQAKAAERFLETLLPRLLFMNFLPSEVVAGEIERWSGRTIQSPAGDLTLLHQFGLPMAEGRGAFHARGLFGTVVRQRARVQGLMTGLAKRVATDYRQFRAMHPPGPKLTKKISSQLSNMVKLPRATEALRIALIEQQFAEGKPELDPHDAIDMLHTIVPVAYCQFALLDGRWCDLVDRARRRLTDAGISGLASVYSERRNGISDVLDALAAYPPAPGEPPRARRSA